MTRLPLGDYPLLSIGVYPLYYTKGYSRIDRAPIDSRYHNVN